MAKVKPTRKQYWDPNQKTQIPASKTHIVYRTQQQYQNHEPYELPNLPVRINTETSLPVQDPQLWTQNNQKFNQAYANRHHAFTSQGLKHQHQKYQLSNPGFAHLLGLQNDEQLIDYETKTQPPLSLSRLLQAINLMNPDTLNWYFKLTQHDYQYSQADLTHWQTYLQSLIQN